MSQESVFKCVDLISALTALIRVKNVADDQDIVNANLPKGGRAMVEETIKEVSLTLDKKINSLICQLGSEIATLSVHEVDRLGEEAKDALNILCIQSSLPVFPTRVFWLIANRRLAWRGDADKTNDI